jgi:hypothetical protein
MLELDDIQSVVLRPRPTPYAATYIYLRIGVGRNVVYIYTLALKIGHKGCHLPADKLVVRGSDLVTSGQGHLSNKR